jgi:hypothetical protein
MVRWSAAEAHARASQGGGVPFFRVRLNPDQHDVLVELENRVSGDGVVRYAAPVFHQIEELWERQSTRKVFDRSAFIAPTAAGAPPSCWTYDDGGVPIFCSEPRRGELETSDGVLRALIRVGRNDARAERGSHLRALASQMENIDLTPRRRRRRIDDLEDRTPYREADEIAWMRPPLDRSEWVERLRRAAPERADADIEAAVDAAVIANTAGSIGLTWLLAEIQPRPVVH